MNGKVGSIGRKFHTVLMDYNNRMTPPQEYEKGSDIMFMQCKIKICKTDFELFIISHFLSLRKNRLTDFYFTFQIMAVLVIA